jgi:integrase
VLAVTAGTGLRFGEISALWVGDVDLDRGTVRVNKAWKRNGEDDATETPGWLSRQLRAKHTMRDHHLGHPKTPRSRRTITIAPAVADLLEKRIKADRRTTSCSPAGLAGRCTTATSTPIYGGS